MNPDLRAIRDFVLDPSLAFESEALADLARRWTAAHAMSGGEIPPREFADPFQLRDHLGHLQLVDIFHDPLRFRYRLIGTAITELAGRDSTGRWFDELYGPAFVAEAFKSYIWVIEQRLPMRVSATWQHVGKGHIKYESLDLPLSSDGRTIDLILTRMSFDNTP